MRLCQNGESLEAACYGAWLLNLGGGKLSCDNDNMIVLPHELCLPPSLSALIDCVFPDLAVNAADSQWMSDRAILAPLNSAVDEINESVIAPFPSEEHRLLSADSVEQNDSDTSAIPVEYLNQLNSAGLPPHILQLKHSMPVILLHNLNQAGGLCNGTRLIVDCIINGCLFQVRVAGTERYTLLPRITLSPTKGTLPLDWQCRQFPIRPAFAITINKSQGKSIARVGVDLRDSVFTHGQLYVAASCITRPNNIRFCVPLSCKTCNEVYTEVLSYD